MSEKETVSVIVGGWSNNPDDVLGELVGCIASGMFISSLDYGYYMYGGSDVTSLQERYNSRYDNCFTAEFTFDRSKAKEAAIIISNNSIHKWSTWPHIDSEEVKEAAKNISDEKIEKWLFARMTWKDFLKKMKEVGVYERFDALDENLQKAVLGDDYLYNLSFTNYEIIYELDKVLKSIEEEGLDSLRN